MRALRPGASVHTPRVDCNRASIDPSGLGPKRSAFMPKREYEIRASAPSKLSLRNLSHCTRIVRTGDAVDPDSAAVELPRSEILALALAGNLIIMESVRSSAGAQDTPARSAERSGVSFDPNTSELGYVAVDPEHRGRRLAERIVRELLANHVAPLFATTSSEPLKRTLARVGFVKRGHAWPGRNGE